jgi:hypothetical protein
VGDDLIPDEAVEMLAEFTVTIVDPDKMWQLPQRDDRDD